ncbi:probable serine/threonine-protein kinase ifkA isoform X2 [Neoarius graeffei]|uniref:probable serine/threonine-protein kinase ifkA isoform X2 n=1 Tax=Neoarius graeffei TaxID=443677 RepID=UPI00298C2DBF|nr:probable serine/threonine-protein kinase ifkA isoform X2 [Neoarius graeffei]
MDIPVGSTCVPEHSACLSESVPRVGNRESSKCSEEQNQSQPHAAPTQSTIRFKIRSAKERQQLTKASNYKCETFEKASRSIKECPEEMSRVHPISSPSPDTDMIDTKRPRVLNQFGWTKKAELSVSSETSSTTQKKADAVENPTTKVRERTEWRQSYLSNRSKSLDWSGSKHEGGQKNQMDVIRNTKDLERRAMRRSESLERNDAASSPKSNELTHPLKRVSLQIQPFSGNGQRKQDNNGLISGTATSGTLPVKTVALAQSFPSRLKANQSKDRMEERKSPWWHSEHSGTKPDQAEPHLRAQFTASKTSEITGNNTVKERNRNVLEDNREASSGISFGMITPEPFYGSGLDKQNPSRRSMDDRLNFYTVRNTKTVLSNPGKSATFPKTPFKKGHMNFTPLPDTSLVSADGKDNLATTSAWSNEKTLSQGTISLVTNNSIYDDRRLTGPSVGLGSHSLGRTRNRLFTTLSSYPAYSLNNSNSVQKNTGKETERQVEIRTRNSNQTKGMETIPGKQTNSSQERVNPQAKPQPSQSMTADSEKHHHQQHGVSMKNEFSLEKVHEPSLDSVRKTIHKFEALALQSQSSSQIQHHRRALSVTETPKVVTSLNKTYSSRSLSVSSGDSSRECSRENLFSKIEKSDEAVSIHDLSGPVQITTQDKEELTVKTQSRGTKSHEPGAVQTLKLLDEFPSEQKNKAKFTMMNKHMDESDFSKGSNLKSYQKLKNIELTEENGKNNLSSTTSHNSQKSSRIMNVSHSDPQDFSPKPENTFSKSTKDKVFLKSQSSPVLPYQNSFTPEKSTDLTGNSTHSKSPSNLFSDSAGISPIQVCSSASGDLSNTYNTIKDEKVAAKVIRWIMDKGVDDENGEDCDDDDDDYDDEDDEGTERGYDSDSGESSVTITSNMSNRSFSMSLVDLCSLGGLDLPPSDSTGSQEDENWMSKRTVSMSSENCEDVHVVVLHKEAGSGIGFTVAGGVDQNKPVTVHKVLRNGIAAQEGSIYVGDQVLSINGTALHNSTHKEALHTMRKARGRAMAVVVIRRGDVTETCASIKDNPQKAAGNPGSRVRVTLNKSSSDLGFSLEGGVGSSLGDKPLTVQRLFQGGPVGKVFPGDELLEVEGQSLEGLRRLEVWHLIKRLPPGPVEVLLQRPYQ